ncbi:NACHT domain-containing protein [Rhizobium leguminosarum]|uniref:NACHT domain-containing protein n=1 Tax=Rhizobium johnstonii TaxID=3019933 RepID=UPI0012F96040
MYSTVQKGNAFRDQVVSILAATNFNPLAETRHDHIKVDVTWVAPQFDESLRYFAEAKDYGRTFTKEDCHKFVVEYGPLVSNDENSRAWLISKGPISPDARALVDGHARMKAMTYDEFQRKILRVEDYLSELRDRPSDEQLDKWYVPPRSEEGRALDEIVMEWLDVESAQQIAIMGGYGKGKSTFAQAMCSKLAGIALKDQTKRVPILIPLGEINDEISLEGLIGKHLAAKAKVHGYSFSLFSRLNQAGRFVIFLDGFDEMKHGMTFTKFDSMFSELLRLDGPRAKIVVLGRDTALHNDEEFRAIIEGQLTTEYGLPMKAPGRRPFTPVRIKDFSVDEAKDYIRRFFPIAMTRHVKDPDSKWIESRLHELTSGQFDTIITRPVHASMLCEIAKDDSFGLQNLTKFGLYERFVHVLLRREVQKKGRDSVFSLKVRQRFNSSLAYWLWENGGAKTVDLESIPIGICKKVTKGIIHGYDDKKLRRELVAGCLVDKGTETFYFSHRSIQEFLVATELLEMTRSRMLWERKVASQALSLINAEIADFLITGAQETEAISRTLSHWLDLLTEKPATIISDYACDVILRVVDWAIVDRNANTPWMDWLSFYSHGKSASRKTITPAAIEDLAYRITKARNKPIEEQAAVLFLVAGLLVRQGVLEDVTPVLAAWFSPEIIADWVDTYDSNSRTTNAVSKNSYLFSWAMLKFTEVLRRNGKIFIRVDLSLLSECAEVLKKIGFVGDDIQAHSRRFEDISLDYYLDHIRTTVGPLTTAKVERYFCDEKIRRRFEPVERRSR